MYTKSLKTDCGNYTLESALLLPLILAVVMGGIDLIQILTAYGQMKQASQEVVNSIATLESPATKVTGGNQPMASFNWTRYTESNGSISATEIASGTTSMPAECQGTPGVYCTSRYTGRSKEKISVEYDLKLASNQLRKDLMLRGLLKNTTPDCSLNKDVGCMDIDFEFPNSDTDQKITLNIIANIPTFFLKFVTGKDYFRIGTVTKKRIESTFSSQEALILNEF